MLQTSLLLMKSLNKTETPIFFICCVFFVSKGNLFDVYFIQFSSRLNSYLSKWLALAKVEKTYEAVCDFMARDQVLESCNRELFVHFKPTTFKNLDEKAREADLFAEARGGVSSCVAKGQPIIGIAKGLVRSSQVGRVTSRKLSAGFVGNHI